MTRHERRLKSVEQEMGRYSAEIQAIWKKAEDEDRETSVDERGEVEERLKAIEALKVDKAEAESLIKVEQEVTRVGREMGATESAVTPVGEKHYPQPTQPGFKTLGEVFVDSDGYKSIQGKSGVFSTGMVELQTKGTLLEGAGSPGVGTGGAFNTVPQVVPGVVEKLFQPLRVADLLASGATDGPTVRYVVEGTATSGATGIPEGGLKPESTLALSTVDEPVKKLATMLVVSDEMLEDASQVQSYINGRLALFVAIEEERQLLLGGGTDSLVGLTGRSGVNTYAGGTAAGNKAVQIFKALNGTRGSSLLEPSAIIVNPADWQDIRLLTDTAGQFFGGGPFQGPYGNGQNLGLGGQLSGATDFLWNKPVVVTTAVGAGTAFLGAFDTAAQIFRRSGLSVEASNSHSDYFQRNLVAIRAEQRLALAVYRPGAFTKVTLS